MGDPEVVLEQGEPRRPGQGGGEQRGPRRARPSGVLDGPVRPGAGHALLQVRGLAQVESEKPKDRQAEPEHQYGEPRRPDRQGAVAGERHPGGQDREQGECGQKERVLQPVGDAKGEAAEEEARGSGRRVPSGPDQPDEPRAGREGEEVG